MELLINVKIFDDQLICKVNYLITKSYLLILNLCDGEIRARYLGVDRR